MNLKDALEQVRREQPHLTGKELRQAVKTLRDETNAVETRNPHPQTLAPEAVEAAPQVPGVGEAWAGLVAVIVITQLAGYLAWGSPFDAPHWYDALHVFLLIAGVVGIVSAYRNRGNS